VRRGSERDKSTQDSVPLLQAKAELALWARFAALTGSGCLLRIAWSDTHQGAAATVVGVDAHPMLRANPARAKELGGRLCQLFTSTLAPVCQLAKRGVRPRDVLTVLWEWDPNQPYQHGDARKRRAEAKALERAAKILDRHRPALQIHTPWVRIIELPAELRQEERFLYPTGDDVRWVADSLRAIASRRGAPGEQHVLAAARGLEYLVKRANGKLVAREITAILRAAWPERPGDLDNDRAARALLARARALSRDKMLRTVEKLDDGTLRLGRAPLLPIPPLALRCAGTPSNVRGGDESLSPSAQPRAPKTGRASGSGIISRAAAVRISSPSGRRASRPRPRRRRK